MKIHVPPVCVLPPFTALFVSGRRRVEGGPAKELNQKDPDQSAQAVKAYVPRKPESPEKNPPVRKATGTQEFCTPKPYAIMEKRIPVL